MRRAFQAAVATVIVGAAIVALLVLQRHDGSQALSSERLALSSSARQAKSGSVASVRSLPSVTASALLSAPVPAGCNHRAGTLVKGRLPGIPPTSGHMQLAWLDNPSSQHNRLALGDLNKDRRADAAAVLDCTGGMGAWPQIIAFYAAGTAGPKLLGSVNLATLNLPGHAPGPSDFVNRVSFRSGGIDVTWWTQQDGDAVAIPTLAYSATLRWNGRSIISSKLSATAEVGTAAQFLADLRRGDHSAAATLAAPGVGAEAVRQFRLHPKALLPAPACRGLIDLNLPDRVKALLDPGSSTGFPHTSRVCLLPAAADGSKHVVLGMRSTGFRHWQVAWIRVV